MEERWVSPKAEKEGTGWAEAPARQAAVTEQSRLPNRYLPKPNKQTPLYRLPSASTAIHTAEPLTSFKHTPNNAIMAHNFAPYQSSPPESTRALSPPLRTSTSSPRPQQVTRAQSSIEDPWAASRVSQLPSPSAYDDLEAADTTQSSRLRGDGYYVFETSLGIRMDIEACLPYLLLPPAGGVAMLIFERKSDYVRYGHPVTRSRTEAQRALC